MFRTGRTDLQVDAAQLNVSLATPALDRRPVKAPDGEDVLIA